MDALPVSNKTAGVAESAQNSILETGAGLTQVSSWDAISSIALIEIEFRTR